MSMTEKERYVTDNRLACERLEHLIAAMSDADLQRPLSAEWTIAAALVHLAFWDCRQLALLKRWQANGVSPAPSDVESINAGVSALALAVPPRAAANLAVSAAEAIDAEVQKLTPELAAAIESAGFRTMLRRSLHRNAHLDDIERALAAPAGSS